MNWWEDLICNYLRFNPILRSSQAGLGDSFGQRSSMFIIVLSSTVCILCNSACASDLPVTQIVIKHCKTHRQNIIKNMMELLTWVIFSVLPCKSFWPQLFCLVSHTKWQLSQSLLPPPRFAEFNDGIGPRRLYHLALQIDSRHRFISQRSSTGHNAEPQYSQQIRFAQKLTKAERKWSWVNASQQKMSTVSMARCTLAELFSLYDPEGRCSYPVWNSMVECKPQVRALNAWHKFSSISPVPVSLSPETVEGLVSTSGALPISEQDQLVSYHTQVREVEKTIEKL